MQAGAGRFAELLEFGQDSCNCAFCHSDEFWVRFGIVWDDQQCLVQRIATRSAPSVIIHFQCLSKRLSPGLVKDTPCGNDISSRIADTDAAKVNDTAETATANKQVGLEQISMYPYRLPIPRR